ncbi:MAG: hypothetical protein HY255_02230 [Betaproteobacteria bacterium]|nr:hypothetical protein [Betaproteobacteria bacterium]
MLLFACVCPAQPAPRDGCDEVLSIRTGSDNTMRYAYAPPPASDAPGKSITLVLLPGGAGFIDLDEQGCARKLKGNSLIRSLSDFAREGFGTALVDAPADYQSDDGLGGYRTAKQHAEDLGKVIAEIRKKTNGAVWVVGTSRGSISAANAASRLKGAALPDGVVLTSILTSGTTSGKRLYVAQTVFDLPLEDIRLPALLIGHANDTCARSPPGLMESVAKRVSSPRKQVVTVTGGPAFNGSGLAACEGHAPHGYTDQEAEVAAGMARFIRGGTY